MGRPRKGEEKNTTEHMGVRVTAETRAAIEKLAKRNGRTITDEIRELIVEGLAAQAKPRKRA